MQGANQRSVFQVLWNVRIGHVMCVSPSVGACMISMKILTKLKILTIIAALLTQQFNSNFSRK